MKMSYRQLADHVKQRQRLLHREMSEPDDDWLPEAFFLRADRLSHQPIPTRWFEDRASKQALFYNVLSPLIRIGHCRAFALTVVMFMLSTEHPLGREMFERHQRGESPTAGMPYLQDIDGSVEQLWVHVFDAERYEGWCAQIKRPTRGRPELGPFEMPGGPDAMVGDLVDPIKAALR